MSGHTPGPWLYYDGGIIGSELIADLDVLTFTTPAEEKAANARLIAAAPMLLAVLEGMICAQCLKTPTEATRLHCPMCRRAREAIKEATGRDVSA